MALGCRPNSPKTQNKNVKSAKKIDKEDNKDTDTHVAPPPAYGNKIVKK